MAVTPTIKQSTCARRGNKLKSKKISCVDEKTNYGVEQHGKDALLKCKVTEIPCGRGESRGKGEK